MEKYTKYIEFVKKSFENSFETSGGKGYRFYHSYKVANLGYKFAKQLKLSETEIDIVVLACLFHDIGKITRIQADGRLFGSHLYEKENNLERHEDISARMVKDILKDDYSQDVINKIASIIADDDQDDILANILHDSDHISELGNMGIVRICMYDTKRSIEDIINYHINVDENKKLEKLATLKLDISKGFAKTELQKITDFMINLKKEIGL